MKKITLSIVFLILTSFACEASVFITGYGSGDFTSTLVFGGDSQDSTSYTINSSDSGNTLVGTIASPVSIIGQTSYVLFTGTLLGSNPNSAFQLGLYDSDGDGLLYNATWNSFGTGQSSTISFALSGSDLSGSGTFSGTVSSIVLTTSGTGSTINFKLDGLSASSSAIPEPSTYAALFGATVLGFAAWRKRRKA